MTYEIRESTRAKYLRISVHANGRIVITRPLRVSERTLERFLREHRAWVEETQLKLAQRHERFEHMHGKATPLPKLRRDTKAYKEAIAEARCIVTARVQYFDVPGNFKHGDISIRNQKTRWGSCSARGALSFNYRLIYLSPEELDYLVVHELAHTKHHNHGKDFWAEVERFVPNWKELRKGLKRYRW